MTTLWDRCQLDFWIFLRLLNNDVIDVQLNCTMCIITGTLLSSALPWLPVLIWLRRQIWLCWPLCTFINYIYLKNYLQTCMLCGHYITVCPQNCQTSCKPLWTDIYPTDIISQWRDERKLALVVNLADEPSVWQPGFNLPINCWALLNRFWTNQHNCTSCWNKGALQQTTCALVHSPNDDTYCQQLPTDQAGGWAAAIALSWWCCHWMAEDIRLVNALDNDNIK